MIYLDSSALVKRYIEEDGSDKVNALLEERSVAAASRLAYPEILAAITRRHKAKVIETGACERIKKAFKFDWASFVMVEFHRDVFQLIDGIINKYPMPQDGAVQVAAAGDIPCQGCPSGGSYGSTGMYSHWWKSFVQ